MDVLFEIKNATIDYSDISNPDNFPESYFVNLPTPPVANVQRGAGANPNPQGGNPQGQDAVNQQNIVVTEMKIIYGEGENFFAT